MKRFALAIALVCAISATALAGEVPTTGAVNPGETQTPPSVTAPGDISTPGIASQGDIPSVPLTVLLAILDFAF